jgi:hypothetical protein
MQKRVDFSSYSDKTKLFLLRLWLPFVLFLAVSTALWGGPHWMVTALPPLLVAVFYLSAAQVRLGEEKLRYRRLFNWQDIPYEEIVECKISAAPGIGVLRLRHLVFPWGKIYFVREEPNQFLWPGGQSQLTRFINARREGKPSLSEAPYHEAVTSPRRRDRTVCALAAFIGVAAAFLSRTLLPDVSVQFDPSTYPHWIAIYQQFQRAIASWPWNLLAGFVLLAIVFALRFKKAWGFAFALGGVVGSVVVSKMIG